MSPARHISEEDALSLLLSNGHVPEEVFHSMPDGEMQVLLPLLLSLCDSAQGRRALQKRVRESRALKLRLQLLRTHAAFKDMTVGRRYSSKAYCGGEEKAWEDEKDEVRFLVDMVDMQSLDFFSNILFRHIHSPTAKFGHALVVHPFCLASEVLDLSSVVSSSTKSGSSSGVSIPSSKTEGSEIATIEFAQTAELRREQDRAIVSMRRMRTGKEGLRLELMDVVGCEIIVRDGERMRDVGMQMLLRVLNALWARPCRQFPDGAAAPFCVAVDMIVTGQGCVERGMRKGIAMGEFHFEYWRYTKGLNPVVADGFVRSAAGLYTAGYVCGLWEKAAEDIGVVDGMGMYLRSVREVFESYGAMRFDIGGALRLAIPREMREAFRALGVWDAFRDTCVKAFAVLRENYAEVFGCLFDLFERAGIGKERIMGHLQGKYSLNLAESDRVLADLQFRKWLEGKLW